jgi:hypothetical protein
MNQGSEQLERLIAERLDGSLTAEQRARLDLALAEDPEAAAMARQYQCLRTLLRGWRTLHRDIDWEALAARIAQRVAESVEQKKDAAVDDMVREAVAPMPEVDWDQFKARVSSAVRHEAAIGAGAADEVPDRNADVGVRAARRRWRRTATWFATVGAPLAAAAAIAIAVWWPGTASQIAPPSVMSVAPMVFVALDVPQASGRVAISFDQAAPAGYTDQPSSSGEAAVDRPAGGGGLAIAVDSTAAEPLESVDEAMFY